MIRFCKVRPDHVCLGILNVDAHIDECSPHCMRERSVDQAPYKVEPPASIGERMRQAHEQLQREGKLETPADVINAELRARPRLANDADESAPMQRPSQVIRFRGITKLDIDPQVVLEGASKAGMKVAIVIGYDADGAEYFASSAADGADVLWHLERAKLRLLRTVDDE